MNSTRCLFTLALVLLLCACSKEVIEDADMPDFSETRKVNLQISTDSWNGASTRALGDDLYPVTLLLVKKDSTKVLKRNTFGRDEDLSLEVPNGSYNIYAVCGLPGDNVPDDLLEEIEIPRSTEGNGLTDFTVGSSTITNEYGKLTPSSVSIMAKRQMARLTVKISDLPAYFDTIELKAKGLGDSYCIADGWSTSAEAESKFTSFYMLKKPNKIYVELDVITQPVTNPDSSTEFQIKVTTTAGETLKYKVTSDLPLVAGFHLTANLSVKDLIPVNGTIDTEDWNEGTITGTLTNPEVE